MLILSSGTVKPKRGLSLIVSPVSGCQMEEVVLQMLPGFGAITPWVELRSNRWDALTSDQKRKFPPIAPDFVLELLSPTDSLRETQTKMQEYIGRGVKLGWLVDPETKRVEIHRSDQIVEVLDSPKTLSGEASSVGASLNLETIW